MDLEQELHHALQRKDPSPDFVERVTSPNRRRRDHKGANRFLALAASIVLLVGSGAAWRHHQGEVAKQQVMAAMRLTAVKLNHIQTHVFEVRQ